MEFEYDNKNLLHVRIDRKRKFYGTVFLRALGLKTDAEILRAFYKCSDIVIKDKKLFWKVSDGLIGHKLSHAIHQGRRNRGSAGPQDHQQRLSRKSQKAKIEQVEVASQRSRRRVCRRRRDRHGYRRSADRGQS